MTRGRPREDRLPPQKDMDMPRTQVNEPLQLSAPLARAWSKELCPSHTEGGCDYYHGFWQYLRLMDLGSTLGGHPQEYLKEFRDLSTQWAGTPRRVLISGCADYSMLAHLVEGFAGSDCAVEFTALDQCQTPLALNDWYAQRAGVSVEQVSSDVLSYRPDDRFDMVVTSSFLGYFPDDVRPSLFSRFHDFLKPGGVLVFSNRLRPHVTQNKAGFSEEDARNLVNAVLERSSRLPPELAMDREEFAAMADAYARRRAPYPVRSVQDIEALAEAAGFRAESARRIASPLAKVAVRGPTLSDGSEFVMMRLRR